MTVCFVIRSIKVFAIKVFGIDCLNAEFCASCVCVCVCVHVYLVYEDTNLYNDMGMTLYYKEKVIYEDILHLHLVI